MGIEETRLCDAGVTQGWTLNLVAQEPQRLSALAHVITDSRLHDEQLDGHGRIQSCLLAFFDHGKGFPVLT